MKTDTDTEKKRAKLTDEQKAECARLADLWRERWQLKGKTQADLADLVGVTPAAISQLMTGRMAVNRRVAPRLAEALDVEIADFSPRLASEMAVRAPATQGRPGPIQARGFQGTLTAAIECLAIALQGAPERRREEIGQQLGHLAFTPDSSILVRRLARMLAPFDTPREPTAGDLIEGRLAALPAPQREAVIAWINGRLDREELGLPSTQRPVLTAVDVSPAPSPKPTPTPAPRR